MATKDSDQSPFEACAHCGTPFRSGERYPVLTREGRDGTLELYSFCDEECKTPWRGKTDP